MKPSLGTLRVDIMIEITEGRQASHFQFFSIVQIGLLMTH